MYDKVVDDFGTPALFTTSATQRAAGPRVVGLSLPPRRGSAHLRGVTAYGLEELDAALQARLRCSFEDRQTGYVNEVRARWGGVGGWAGTHACCCGLPRNL